MAGAAGGGMVGTGSIPDEAFLAVAGVDQALSRLEEKLGFLLPLLQSHDLLRTLSPLHRAAAFLSISKALNAVFTVHLRCKGISLDDHPANAEVERVSLYDTKIGYYLDDLKGPRHRTTLVNVQAANRMIEHAIPDLTEDQRKDLQLKASRKSRNLPTRPVRPEQTKSLTEAVSSFLEEAKKELQETQKAE